MSKILASDKQHTLIVWQFFLLMSDKIFPMSYKQQYVITLTPCGMDLCTIKTGNGLSISNQNRIDM